jgi:hypothetical protein
VTSNRPLPFSGRHDARRCLLEYLGIAALLAFGLGAFTTSGMGVVVGIVSLVLGTMLCELILGKRGRVLPIRSHRVFQRSYETDEARAVEVMCLKYVRSALIEVGIPSHLSLLMPALALGLGLAGHLAFR